MDLYTFLLSLGGAGLLLMALLGVSHSHAGSHGRANVHHGPGAAHHTAGHHHMHHGDRSVGGRLTSLLSPRLLFSFFLGAGTAGVALRTLLPEPILVVAAVVGGVAFERMIVNPLWNFMFRFASSPATTLESAVEDEAKAVTNFDQSGQGLIAVEVDGHIVQVLATLSRQELEAGARVRAGDIVRIEDVDADRNRCTIRRI